MAERKTKSHKPTPKPVLFLTPVCIFTVCAAITVLAGIKPYNKFVTYVNIAFSDRIQSTASASESITISDVVNDFKKDSSSEKSETGTVVYPKYGEQYAMISCEAVNLYVPVYWGSSDELLSHGACQLTSSVVAGEKGNVVIDAHVNTYFSDLDKLREGDIVKISTSYGDFSYMVKSQAIFEKTDKKYISQDGTDKLTLYTCVKQVLGSSTQRLAVVCEPVEKAFYN